MFVNVANESITTLDWITLGISIIGCALSIYNFVVSLFRNAKRLSVSVKHLYKFDGHVVMLVEFTNRSHFGISITSGKLVSALNKSVVFGETGCELFRYNDPDSRGKVSERTVIFPVTIDPLRSECVLLLTEDGLPGFSCSYKIVLGSSRGKISKKLVLPTPHADFVSLLEHLN